ncbi:hypothetical protein FRC01_003465 [Tulasnella sp. 417]|nr:hypothetical protein FRC01_003465 [Tulasnella sp. 417]
MLSKLFRRRQPTASPSPPFEPSPTVSQPGDSKTPSRFIRKIKQFKNALRPKSSNRKLTHETATDARYEQPQDNDQGNHKPQKNHKQSPLNEGFGNGRAPFTAEDSQFRHRAAIVAQQNPRPSVPSIIVHPPTATPTTNRDADTRASTPVGLALEPPAQCIPTLDVEAELLTVKRCLKQRRALEFGAQNDEGEIRAIRSRQAESVAPGAKPALRLPAKTQLVSVTEAREKTAKQRMEQGNKWWEMGGNLCSSDHKRYFRKDAMDFGNPHTGYRNIADFAVTVYSLKGGRPNQRRQPPHRIHSSNQAEAKDDAAENAPINWKEKIRQYYLAGPTEPDERHGQTSTIAKAAEAPNVPVGVWSLTATQDPLLAARQPLRLLDSNLLLNGRARAAPQADFMVELQDEGSGSNENRVRASNSNPPQEFEQVVFPRRRNRASAQF